MAVQEDPVATNFRQLGPEESAAQAATAASFKATAVTAEPAEGQSSVLLPQAVPAATR
jgi:hypothetical protein